jgi:hypothetical protein
MTKKYKTIKPKNVVKSNNEFVKVIFSQDVKIGNKQYRKGQEASIANGSYLKLKQRDCFENLGE